MAGDDIGRLAGRVWAVMVHGMDVWLRRMIVMTRRGVRQV